MSYIGYISYKVSIGYMSSPDFGPISMECRKAKLC
jgi:hypothetical protein